MSSVIFEDEWPEYVAGATAFLGFIAAMFMRNSFFSIITIIILGFMLGRFFYKRRFNEPILPFVLIISATALGYLIGTFFVSRLLILLLFLTSFTVSYQLHKRKIIKIFKSEDFMK
ncbi:hypothetical protein HN385_06985 [archaeon]|jgi:hypothetical protein|nr:hypothetical protein [archaeon]MBT3451018.1 hypothetical protein [archaeon]MBT6868562.1 hypothetical protein [archaeon]MBT7193094.1 hypothetical protein [archaeon]MBT7380411.1 hypothetical protein [archaeon]